MIECRPEHPPLERRPPAPVHVPIGRRLGGGRDDEAGDAVWFRIARPADREPVIAPDAEHGGRIT